MKTRLFSLFLIIAAFCTSLNAAAQGPIPAGYYMLTNQRTPNNAMYVGQVQSAPGFVSSTDNLNALQVCWRRYWTLPEVPDRETARYIFRIEQCADSLYTLQNLGYNRYVRMPSGIYHACPTTTTPEEKFEIKPSMLFEDYYTLHGTSANSIYSYVHASNDLNNVVEWERDSEASHWRIIPVEEAYAQEAYRIFNPYHESAELSTRPGHICDAPDVASEALADTIVSLYKGQPVFVFAWKNPDASDPFHVNEAKFFFEHALSTFQIMRESGVKMVFITEENFPIYDWLEIVKTTEGDHYRVPSLENFTFGKKTNYGSTYALFNSEGRLRHIGASSDFPLTIYTILPSLENLQISPWQDTENDQ